VTLVVAIFLMASPRLAASDTEPAPRGTTAFPSQTLSGATVRHLTADEVTTFLREDPQVRDAYRYAQELGFRPTQRAVQLDTPEATMTVALFFSEQLSGMYLIQHHNKAQGTSGVALCDVVKDDKGTLLLRLYSPQGRVDVDIKSRRVVTPPPDAGTQKSQVDCNSAVCFGYFVDWFNSHNPCSFACGAGSNELYDLFISLTQWFNGQADPSYNPAVHTITYLLGDMTGLVQDAALTVCESKQDILNGLQNFQYQLNAVVDYDTAADFSQTLSDFVEQNILGKCGQGTDIYDAASLIQNAADLGELVKQIPDLLNKAKAFKIYGTMLLEGIGLKVFFDLLNCGFCSALAIGEISGGWLACQLNPCGYYPCETVCEAQNYSFSSSPYCKNDDVYVLTTQYQYGCSSTIPMEGICALQDTILQETLVQDCAYGCNPTTSQCKSSCSTGTPGAQELCNGIDDNCDGITDEGCSCVNGQTKPCGTDVGACSFGTQTCVSGQWGPCTGGQGPTTEVCPHDGVDNNCDGQTDENICGGDENECYNWTIVVNEPPYSGYVDTIKYGPYCANNYQWKHADVDNDGYLEHYMLAGDTYKVWFRCEVKSGYLVSDMVNFAQTMSYGCYDGDCDEKVENAVTVTKTYTGPVNEIGFPDILCLSNYPAGNPYGYGFYGGKLWEYWDTNENGQFDVGEHSENYLVLNCGADADCGPGNYCKKPDSNPLSNVCVSCLQAELCNDGVDNDCDGFVDCNDGDCGLGVPAKNGFCCGAACSVNGGNCVEASPTGQTCSDGSCNTYGEACRNGELESSLQCAGTTMTCSGGGSCEEAFGAPPSCDETTPHEDACEHGGSFNERACEVTGTDCVLSAESTCGAPQYCDEKEQDACSSLAIFQCDWQGGSGDDVAEICAAACGADASCDQVFPGSDLPGCAVGKTYFSDTCSAICTGEDNAPICRSSLYAAGCTADPACEGVMAGTQDCTLACQQNTPPTPPTAMQCNDGNCTGLFSGTIDVVCSGATDAQQDPLVYTAEEWHEDEQDVQQPGWWNPAFPKCFTVTLDTASPLAYESEPVDLMLDASVWTEAPFKDSLRVVDAACGAGGQEIPSQTYESTLVGTTYQSTRLVFLATRPAGTPVAYGIYYATTDQGAPTYSSDLVHTGDCVSADCTIENAVVKAWLDHAGGVIHELVYKPFSLTQGLIGWDYENAPDSDGSLGMLTNTTWTGPGTAIFDRTVTDAACSVTASGPVVVEVTCAKPGGLAWQAFRFYRGSPWIDVRSSFNGGTAWGDTVAFYTGGSTGPTPFSYSYGSNPSVYTASASAPVLTFGDQERTRVAISKSESNLSLEQVLAMTYASQLPHPLGVSNNGGQPSFGGTWYPLSVQPFPSGTIHPWRLIFTTGSLEQAMGPQSVEAYDRFVAPLVPTFKAWTPIGTHPAGGSVLWDTSAFDAIENVHLRCVASAEGQQSQPLVSSGTLTIDNLPPVTSGVFPQGWQSMDALVTLTCTDSGGAGCATIDYCVDQENACLPLTPYQAPVLISNEGTHYLRIQAKDNAGNLETIQSHIVLLDKTPPSLVIESPTNNSVYPLADLPVVYEAADALSGIQSCWYTLDDGMAQTLPACEHTILQQLSPGPHNLTIGASDVLGHETATTVAFTIDNLPPVTSASVPQGWQSTDALVTLTCTDAGGAGCATTLYCLDQNNSCVPFLTYSAPFFISTEGTNYLRFHSQDIVNNSETIQVASIALDITPPAITLESPKDITYAALPIPLSYTVTDAFSGVASCWYTLDESPPQALPSCAPTTLQVTAGPHSLTLFANDAVGHPAFTSVTFTLNTPPTIPTSLSCNGAVCKGTFFESVALACSGSSDSPGDLLMYDVEASLGTWQSCRTVTFTDPLPQPIPRPATPVFLDLSMFGGQANAIRVIDAPCGQGGNEVPSYASLLQGTITFLADIQGKTNYAIYYGNSGASLPTYPGSIIANDNYLSWAPQTDISLNCELSASIGRVTCNHQYPTGYVFNTAYPGAAGPAVALSFYADGWHTFDFTLQESSATYAFWRAVAKQGTGWAAEIHAWSNAKSPLLRIIRTGPPITLNEVRFFDTRYYNPSFDTWISTSMDGTLASVLIPGFATMQVGWPPLSGYWSSTTGEALLFLPGPDTAAKLDHTAKGFCLSGPASSCNYALTNSTAITMLPGETLTLFLEDFPTFQLDTPAPAFERALAAAVPPAIEIGEEVYEVYGGDWNLIGTHSAGEAVVWNLNTLSEKAQALLRCRAIDTVGAASPYYTHDTPITVTPSTITPKSPPIPTKTRL
jgi:hypothetical protein